MCPIRASRALQAPGMGNSSPYGSCYGDCMVLGGGSPSCCCRPACPPHLLCAGIHRCRVRLHVVRTLFVVVTRPAPRCGLLDGVATFRRWPTAFAAIRLLARACAGVASRVVLCLPLLRGGASLLSVCGLCLARLLRISLPYAGCYSSSGKYAFEHCKALCLIA